MIVKINEMDNVCKLWTFTCLVVVASAVDFSDCGKLIFVIGYMKLRQNKLLSMSV